FPICGKAESAIAAVMGAEDRSGQEAVRLEAVVSGRVQGVGYRYFVVDAARQLGLTGWVRNMHDGRVQVVAEGPRERLMRLLLLLERGPRLAVVDRVQAEWSPATGEFRGFSIRV
ncbi:MAG: acylphosphatase, partial [Armatimonadota bacterium]